VALAAKLDVVAHELQHCKYRAHPKTFDQRLLLADDEEDQAPVASKTYPACSSTCKPLRTVG